MEHIWFEDIQGFMTPTNFLIFFPSSAMTLAEQLNALFRFTIYLSVIAFLIKNDTTIFFAPILMALLSYMIYTTHIQHKNNDKKVIENMGLQRDKYSKRVCQPPSIDNPFMNVLTSDYKDNPTRPKACRFSGKTKQRATKFFNHNLYRNTDDIFQKNASDRQFYTTPITTIPNDMDGFAKWLYQSPKTCKEGNGNVCYTNLHNSHVR